MYAKTVTIHNPSGLHARPATEFSSAAAKFKSRITIRNAASGARAVNAKSVVMVLSQGFTAGTAVYISAEGEDEREAVDTLATLVGSGLGEEK